VVDIGGGSADKSEKRFAPVAGYLSNIRYTVMELTVSTPAILFSTVSLLMLAFTNRFLAISSLIRTLHEKVRDNPERNYTAQIKNLHRRLILIRNIQILSIFSLLVSAVCMLTIFGGNQMVARYLFGMALVLQIAALGVSAVEISISINALQIELADMEDQLGQRGFERTGERLRALLNRQPAEQPDPTAGL
jgi:hypothetical protein